MIRGRSSRQFRGRKEGRQQIERRGLVALCSWAGDLCQGPSCTYAYCERRALLPDETCSLELRKGSRRVRSIEEEAEKEELKLKLKGKTLRRIRELEYIE